MVLKRWRYYQNIRYFMKLRQVCKMIKKYFEFSFSLIAKVMKCLFSTISFSFPFLLLHFKRSDFVDRKRNLIFNLNSAVFFLVRKFYMLRCLFGALYVDMRCFGVSWVFSKHKIPNPNQWGSMITTKKYCLFNEDFSVVGFICI